MPTKRDYYEILSVSKDAGDAELKRAYRKLAMKYHPDRNPDDPEAEKKFKEAAEAFDVLKDPDKRARYDRFGHEGLRGAAGFGGDFHEFSFDDIFSRFGDIFGGDIFGGMGGQGSGRRRRSSGKPGSDLKVKIDLTLEEIATGTEKTIKVKKYVLCEKCKGTGAETEDDYMTCGTCNGTGEFRQATQTMFGQFVNVQACPTCYGEGRTIKNKCAGCGGEGRIKGEETEKITIPAGVTKGNYLTLRNRGNAGVRGGYSGTLVVLLDEKEHEHFKREGDDILYDLKISIPDAILGTSVEVPTLAGKVRMKIDPGTQPGKMLRLREKGIKSLQRNKTGDQYVRINVYIPKKISEIEKTKILDLSESKNFDPEQESAKAENLFERMKSVFS